jgi:RHS repeat-associated protein
LYCFTAYTIVFAGLAGATTNYLNLNMGSGSKVGLAATGATTNDSWNLIPVATNIGASYMGYTIYKWESKTNLVWHTGATNTISVSITNLTYVDYNGSGDAMFNSYLGSDYWLVMDYENEIYISADPKVVVEHLPAGVYEFWIYALGASEYEDEGFRIKVGTNAYTGWVGTYHPGSVTTDWEEGTQYVRFTNLTVNAGNVVLIDLNAGMTYKHFLNGIQVVQVQDNSQTQLPGVTFNPTNGTTVPVSVTLSVTNHSGATIYYTLDGSTPTTNSSVYSSAISLTTATTVKAFAVETGYGDSSVGSATYPLPQLPDVTFSPASGAYLPTNVTLTVAGYTNASIYYTLDGTTPTTSSTLYTAPVELTTNAWTFSANVVPTMTGYTTPGGNTVTYSSELTNSTAKAWKAFDHSIASAATNHWMAAGPGPEWVAIEFPSQRVVAKYAILSRQGATDGPQAWRLEGWDGSQYVVLDTRSDETSWESQERREFVCTNNHSYLKYRLYVTAGNPSTSNSATNICIGEVEMFEAKATIAAFAVQTNCLDSAVTFADYHALAETIPQIVPTPQFSPIAGTFNNDISVTIASALGGSSISYTTNGTDWLTYSSPIAMSRLTTLRAYATKAGYSNSLTRVSTYRFAVAPTTILPNGGVFTNEVEVTLTNITVGAALRYRINGAESEDYTGPFVLTSSAQLLVVATRSNYESSTNIAHFAIYSTNQSTSTRLLNINFQQVYDTSSYRTGMAVVGFAVTDYWNVVTIGNQATNQALWFTNFSGYTNPILTVGISSNLTWSDGSYCPAAVWTRNFTNFATHTSFEPLLKSHLSSSSVLLTDYNQQNELVTIYSDSQVILTNLPTGLYDLYIYAYPNNQNPRRVFGYGVGAESVGHWQGLGAYDWVDAYWEEGRQYLKFQNIGLLDGETLTIGFGEDDYYGFPDDFRIAGLQLVARLTDDPYPPNTPPNVFAGYDQSLLLTNAATLLGVVTDDGMPQGSVLTYQWTMVSGPTNVSFGSSTSLLTTASFPTVGTYSLRLAAFDTLETNYDDVEIIVTQPSAPSVQYDILDLGLVTVRAINDLGQIVGAGAATNGAFLWAPERPGSTNGVFKYTWVLLNYTNLTMAYYSLNNFGDIAASSTTTNGWWWTTNSYESPWTQDLALLLRRYAWEYGAWGGDYGGVVLNFWQISPQYDTYFPAQASGVNNRRDAIWNFTKSDYPYLFVGAISRTNVIAGPYGEDVAYSTYVWPRYFGSILNEQSGLVGTNGDNASYATSMAYGLNDHGAAVGVSGGFDPRSANGFTAYGYEAYRRAFYWSTNGGEFDWLGTMINLGTLRNPPDTDYRTGRSFSEAYAVNNLDMVVGQADSTDVHRRAFLWTTNGGGTMRDLGTLVGTSGSTAVAINNSPVLVQMVGQSGDRAFVYDAVHQMQELKHLIHTNAGWSGLLSAVGINDSGQIIGLGQRTNNEYHSYLLTPLINFGLSISITNLTNGQRFVFPTNILIEAEALSTNGSIVEVEFYGDYKSLGVDTNEPYSITWSNVANAFHIITARAVDSAGAVAWAKPISLSSTNKAPAVQVDADFTKVIFPTNINLTAFATDDHVPLGSILTYLWTKVSGPGDVTFGSPYATNTTASFSTIGIYVLRVTVSDGELSSSDDITITVAIDNQAPVVDAGPDQTLIVSSADLNAVRNGFFAGKVVFSHDEWFLNHQGFDNAPTGAYHFITNLVDWFTEGAPSRFHGYSTEINTFPESPQLDSTLTGMGHDWAYGTNFDFTLPNLLTYDGIFLAGDAADPSVLINYVRSGGNVFLQTGTVAASAEQQRWNPFLRKFNLKVSSLDGIIGVIPITNQHVLFTNISSLYHGDGMEVVLISSNRPYGRILEYGTNSYINTNINSGRPYGLYGIYGEKPMPHANLVGTVSDDGFLLNTEIEINWSVLAGPGHVRFLDPHSPATQASFTAAGTYVLRLTAFDGELTSYDDVTITLNVFTFEEKGELLNLNVGSGNKVGTNAVGFHLDDQWNLLGFSGGAFSGSYSNLFWANGNLSPVAVTVTNLTYMGTNSSSDAMFKSYASGAHSLYDPGIGNYVEDSQVKLEHLAAGSYDIYVYAHGTGNVDIGRFKLFVGGTNVGDELSTWPGSDLEPSWLQDYHYVKFAAVQVATNQTVAIKLYPVGDPEDPECICYASSINGVQILRNPQLPLVVFDPPSATATIPVSVSLSLPTNATYSYSGATIYYTLNGSVPTTNSFVYSNAVSITTETTINAFARLAAFNDSGVSSATYSTIGVWLTSPTNNTTFPSPATIDLVAAFTNTIGGPTKVEFFSNDEFMGVCTSAPYSLTLTNLEPDIYSFVARATATNGTYILSAPVQVTVNTLPTITLTGPPNGVEYTLPTAIHLYANASDSDGLIDHVEFYAGDVRIGKCKTAPYTVAWENPPVGTYVFSARAVDELGGVAFSGTVTNTVVLATNQTLTVNITSPATNTAFKVRTNILISASVHSTSNAIDHVDFYAGPLKVGTVSEASFDSVWIDATAGSHYLMAVAVDTAGRMVASPAVPIEVEWTVRLGSYASSGADVQIPVAGLPLTLNRVYDTKEILQGDFGWGWRQDVSAIRIVKTGGAIGNNWKATMSGSTHVLAEASPHTVSIVLAGGESFHFSPAVSIEGGGPAYGPNPGNGYAEAAIEFVPQPGTQGELVALNGYGQALYMEDNSGIWSGAVTLLEDGNDPGSAYNPTSFRFTTQDGRKFEFDSDGKLLSMKDPNGNTLTFTSDAITFTNSMAGSEKKIRLARDGSGRITSAVDPVGWALAGTNALPVMKYDYDGNGNLSVVHRLTDRTTTNSYQITRYFYGDDRFPHHVTKMFNHDGNQVIKNDYDQSGQLMRQTDALGYSFTHVVDYINYRYIMTNRVGTATIRNYDLAGRVISTVVNGVTLSSVTYDERGRVQTTTDATGAPTSIAYDDQDRPIASTNALGQVTSQTYGVNNQPETTTDARGNTPVNEYDANGNLIKMTDPLGTVSGYAYDAVGNRIRETNAMGTALETVTRSAYNQFGWLLGVTNALGHVTSYTYDDNGSRLTETSSRTRQDTNTESIVTTQVYDAQNRVIRTVNALGHTNLVFYNTQGKQNLTVDAMSRTNRFQYDLLGQLTNTVHADGLGDFSFYDPEGRVTNSLDRAGNATRNVYDAFGRLELTIFADGATNRTVYDAAGRVLRTVDARGYGPVNAYDAVGRCFAVTNALGQTTVFGFDPNGNQTVLNNAVGIVVTNGFDALNRVTNVVHLSTNGSVLAQMVTRYDAQGRQVQTVNAAGVVTAVGYDALGRLISVTNALGTSNQMVTRFEYDEVGHQMKQVDALGRETKYEYDALGRRLWRELPEGQKEYYAYNAAFLVARTNFNGVIITFTNDVLGRLVTKRYPDSNIVSFKYDALGHRTNMVDASGTTAYKYNERGRLTEKMTPWGTTLDYSYDANGNLLGIVSSNPNGVVVTNTWDALNRLASVTDPNVGMTTYQYDALGNLHSIVYPNAITNTYSYDPLNRLTNLVAASAGGTMASYAYRVGVVGNRTNVVELSGRTVAYEYDSLYRLNQEMVTGDSITGDVSYRYDGVGNRTNRVSTLAGVSSSTNSFSANDWLTSDAYDSNGNTTNSIKGADYYDYENRLVRRVDGGATILIAYDGDGNRVKKSVISGGVTNSTWYLVDDRNPTGYAQVLEELQLVEGQLSTVRAYNYGHDLIAQEQLVDGEEGLEWQLNVYGYDGHGSVRYLTAINGGITDTYDYDASGILINSSGTTPNNYRYTGEQWDPDLGFYYLRARYLDPETARFWTLDDFEGTQSNPSGLHKYLYCQGNPVNGIDPSGHDGDFISLLGSMSIQDGMQGAKVGTEAKIKWEMRDFQKLIANDLSPGDLKGNEILGGEGEMVWTKYLNEIGFRAIRAKGAVSAVGPDVFGARVMGGRLEILIGEVKASQRTVAGIGKLKWNTLNQYRQMSYGWIDKYASQVVDGLKDLGISGIGAKEFERLLDRGEIDLYLLGAFKNGKTWKLRGFRLLHVNMDDAEIADFGDPKITQEHEVDALPGF